MWEWTTIAYRRSDCQVKDRARPKLRFEDVNSIFFFIIIIFYFFLRKILTRARISPSLQSCAMNKTEWRKFTTDYIANLLASVHTSKNQITQERKTAISVRIVAIYIYISNYEIGLILWYIRFRGDIACHEERRRSYSAEMSKIAAKKLVEESVSSFITQPRC